MGFVDNLGRVAEVYMREKGKLLESESAESRRRTFAGHLFWPHEILRDTIILFGIMAVMLFYSYLIPPPLHAAADPMAQAGFVFPDWYVLFSYGYLRWGEYLPQMNIPMGPIGEMLNQPVYPLNAAAWGVFLTGVPVGVLALPPMLGRTARRGVEDPWFAVAGVVYLAHVWFISVFSINIFLDLYGKNRTDACRVSHGELICGVRQPWIADVFNSIPWVLTGILIWILIYFFGRGLLVSAIGVRTTPALGKQIAVTGLVIAVMFSVATFDFYDRGFWEVGGLGAMDDETTLDKMVDQPTDSLIEADSQWASEGEVISAYQMANFHAQIFQPTRLYIIDYLDENNHQDAGNGINAMSVEGTILESTSNFADQTSGTLTITHAGIDEVPVRMGCDARTSERDVGTITSSFVLSKNDAVVISTTCGETLKTELGAGEYTWELSVDPEGIDVGSGINTTYSAEFLAFQPLQVYDQSHPRAGQVVNLSTETDETAYGMLANPSYHKNTKSLDAKLIYSLFIPSVSLGAILYVVLRGMARGYEYEMNKCYGCDLCDDACPVRLFNDGDKLNIIYNTWNNEHDGVPMNTCLTCSACTNVCPQLVDYDSYVDIRRNLMVGGPAASDIPHTVLAAVLAAEAEEEADADFISVEEYPIDSKVGYYPGCVDYIDAEMMFSHLNEGSMNLGQTTTAAFTLFKEMGKDVTYLGRDFLKCCGHDQKWQGMDEVFQKLKAYNERKLKDSGIDTLVSSCAECFRTFAMDYELDGIKVMHTTEYLIENGFDTSLSVDDETTVTYHDPCRLGRQTNIYEEPRSLVRDIEGVTLVEMEHHGEDGLCCGVSAMMSCNENSRALRVQRFDEVRAAGAEIMLTTCPKCVSHFECLKFEGDPKHDFEILDVVSFLARQVEAKNSRSSSSALAAAGAAAAPGIPPT